MTEEDVAAYAHLLLNVAPSAIADLAEQEMICSRIAGEQMPPSLFLHSATATIKCLEGDVDDLLSGRVPRDMATFVETRAIYLGTTSDLTVGRTWPWSEAARSRGVPSVDVGKLDYYYLSQALLKTAQEYITRGGGPMGAVVEWLRARPHAVIRLYVLDVEMQIFLIWLRRIAGLSHLYIDANKPLVDARWNRKSHIHPTVARARSLDVAGLAADELLITEQRRSEAFVRLGLEVPVLPGYTIPRTGVDEVQFVAEVLEAARLLQQRYGIVVAALKPSQSGEGARIVGQVNLQASGPLAALAAEVYAHGDDYLLEAWVEFTNVTIGAMRYPLAPSGHLRNGSVAEGLTLQTLERYRWTGNVFTDEIAWCSLGLPLPIYQIMRQSMDSLHDAFVSSHSIDDGSYEGLVTGGIDFAIGRTGGRFGERILVGAIDYNLSSNGAEYMRAFRDEVRGAGVPEQYVATRVFRPSAAASFEQTQLVVRAHTNSDGLATVVACVPDRWGMVAVTGADLPAAMNNAERMVNVLVRRRLATSYPNVPATGSPSTIHSAKVK